MSAVLSRIPLDALKKGIYDRLSGALAPTKVYDFVPEDAAFPYVSVDDPLGVPTSSKGHESSELTIQLDIYSSARGGLEARTIAESVVSNVESSTLTLEDSYSVSLQRLEFFQELREYDKDRDRWLRRVILRWRFRIYSTL